MNSQTGNLMEQRAACDLDAECINVAGRSNAFKVRLIDITQNEMLLISRKPVRPGTYLILRLADLPSVEIRDDSEYLRMNGLIEVSWADEVIEEDGLVYALGVKYVAMY
jgi:hypothetical protein